MFRIFIAATMLSASAWAPAQTTVPAARPPAARAPSSDELKAWQREAFALMKAEQYAKAEQKLDRVYAAIPQAQHSRALVFNHAIVDVVQEKFAMRGVRDLTDYLRRNRGEDEPATNILAIALNVGAKSSSAKSGAVWQAGFKEWDRRNYLLDQSRPGYRRWGTRWVTDEEFKKLDAQRQQAQEDVAQQIDRIERATERVGTLIQKLANARDTARQLQDWNTYLARLRIYNASQMQNSLLRFQGQIGLAPVIVGAAIAQQQQEQGTTVQNQVSGWPGVNNASVELQNAIRNLDSERIQLTAVLKARDATRPDWPKRPDPVDPDAPPPAPTTAPAAPAAGGAGPATQPAAPQAILRPSQFDPYAQPAPKR